jgi:hypothetical protein
MNRSKHLKAIHPVLILFPGLIVAQVIATIQVYLSNLELFKNLTAIGSAGYLAIPNKYVMGSLNEFGTAFLGGLFFTFTIGIGICLGAMAAAWIWLQVLQGRKRVLIYFYLFWAGLMAIVNSNGFNLLPTLYFLLVAPVTFALTARRESSFGDGPDLKTRLIHVIPIPLLALMWFTQFNNAMFLDLRDNLLLSNQYGRKFSDFYYAYTLYPAEAFKALNQKTIKSVTIKNIQSRSTNLRIQRQLTANDYLPVEDIANADIVIYRENDHLIFGSDGRQVFKSPIDQFLTDSRQVLQKLSTECDRNAVFRQFTFMSLTLGYPVFLYMILHGVLYHALFFIPDRRKSSLAASVICLLFGILVLVYFQSNRSTGIEIQDFSEALASDMWQTRVAALKMIEQKKMEIVGFRNYPIFLENRPPQERYWLARTLAHSRRPEATADLLKFLKDSNLNVRTMAYYALGMRKDPATIGPILSKIQESRTWYEQMYAYKALRTIGWKQKRSQ